MTYSTDITSPAGEVEGAQRSEVRLIGRHVLLFRQRRISPAFPHARFPPASSRRPSASPPRTPTALTSPHEAFLEHRDRRPRRPRLRRPPRRPPDASPRRPRTPDPFPPPRRGRRRRMAASRRGQGWRDVLRRHSPDPPRRHRPAACRPRSGAHRGRNRALRRARSAVLSRHQPGQSGQAPGACLAALARLGRAGLRRATAGHRRDRANPPTPGQRRGLAPGGGGAGRGASVKAQTYSRWQWGEDAEAAARRAAIAADIALAARFIALSKEQPP